MGNSTLLSLLQMIHTKSSTLVDNKEGYIVAYIMNQRVARAMKYYGTKSERFICMKIQAKPTHICIIQVFAPNENEDNTEKDLFYEELHTIIKEHKKSRDQIVIMGDFNAKVGDKR